MASETLPLETSTWGGGDRRILLLHGIGSNAAGWWRVGAELASRGWTVVAPDLRGHGSSPKSDDYRLSTHASDVLNLSGPWNAVLGHSMGGAIATLAATRDPGWTESLVLQDPALMMPESLDEVRSWLLDDFERPVTAEQVLADNPRWHPRDAQIKAEALAQVGPDAISETLDVNWPWMVLTEAAGLTVPALVLGSDPETGGLLPVAVGRWLQDSNPLIEYTVVPGSSHSAHRDSDHFDAFLSAVVDGLDRLPTLGRS